MGMLPKIFEILEGDGRDVVDLKQRMHAVEKGLR